MKGLQIADHLSLPLDVVTQTIAILAKRRAGKSYTMRRISEQLLHGLQQIVIVDPKGDQWGIRSSADGRSAGLPVVILGGERGDVPLEPQSGEVVAKLVTEERVSVLLDLSLFRKHEVATFMTAFLENLYRLKAHEVYRTPLMLVIDEADAIAPQKPQKGEERMLGAAEDIVRRGGQRGIGCILVTQRSAVLNKNVLTQAQMIIALRTIAPQDLAAMRAWVDVHGTPEQCRTLMDSLPSLPIGDAWFWSPGWPTVDGIFKRAHVLPIETFDSGATLKPGVKPVEPKQVAEVDLEALRVQMAATIERTKADDPKTLKKKIKELEATVRLLQLKEQKEQPVEVVTREVPVLPESTLKHLDGIIAYFDENVTKHLHVLSEIRGEIVETCAKFRRDPVMTLEPPRSTAFVKGKQVATLRHFEHDAVDGKVDLSGPESRILNACAWLESLGQEAPKQVAVAFLAGYTYGAGAFNNPRGALQQKGLLEYVGDGMRLTEAGKAHASWPATTLTNYELHRKVLNVLPGPEQKILTILLEAYPRPMPKDTLAERAGYTPGTGGFNNPCGRLRSLGLIDYPAPGMAIAESLLFVE